MEKETRLRVALAVIQQGSILLVPHVGTDVGPVQWNLPGGKVEFCECMREAVIREFFEETGLRAEVIDLLDASEVIHPDRPYHSVTITFLGRVVAGEIRPEINHAYGEKMPKWFKANDLTGMQYHPAKTIEKALAFVEEIEKQSK